MWRSDGTTAGTFLVFEIASGTDDGAMQFPTPVGNKIYVSALDDAHGRELWALNVAPPAVTTISPTTGSSIGGTSVTITGTNFTSATSVKFGGNNATSFTIGSDTVITAMAPAGSGVVDVTVGTTAGTSATSAADQFTYVAPPRSQIYRQTSVPPPAARA